MTSPLTLLLARANIEEDYSRKLLALCRKPLGSCEAGTLRASLDIMRGEIESMGKSHQGIAAQMKSELEEPLSAFAGGMKERRKIVQSGVEKLYKVKLQQTQTVNKVYQYLNNRLDNPYLSYSSLEIDTNRTASKSKAILLKAIWSWARKNARIRQRWKRLRYN